MKFNAGNIVMFGLGIVLLYSAITDTSPKDVIGNAFNQSNTKQPGKSTARKPAKSQAPNSAKPASNRQGTAEWQQPFGSPVTSN